MDQPPEGHQWEFEDPKNGVHPPSVGEGYLYRLAKGETQLDEDVENLEFVALYESIYRRWNEMAIYLIAQEEDKTKKEKIRKRVCATRRKIFATVAVGAEAGPENDGALQD